ncbi:MAG: nucleotidyl transferase AbiEii/AbiGii toxin family protein [Deltaproteobacteria bacterium]|nr:nucleotidyl transferase AbiEii/AbiGii toxin family protein [Deltaproteobacteria bacterium]
MKPLPYRVYPVETHIAEKFHAYTMPRRSPNSRVKDLPDIALLATARPLAAGMVRVAIERTFQYRATHAVPQTLPDPAAGWKLVYERIAHADDLPWKTIEHLVDAVRRFMDPLLGGVVGMWNPRRWAWESWSTTQAARTARKW